MVRKILLFPLLLAYSAAFAVGYGVLLSCRVKVCNIRGVLEAWRCWSSLTESQAGWTAAAQRSQCDSDTSFLTSSR